MGTLAEFRRQYPQYDDVDDRELAVALHEKYYADVPFDQFAREIQLRALPQGQSRGVAADPALRDINGLASQVRGSLPFTDEIMGAVRGAGRAVDAFARPERGGASVMDQPRAGQWTLPQRAQAAGAAYRQGYEEEVATERETRNEYASRKPLESIGAQLPVMLGTGAAAARMVPGGGNLLMRAAKAGGVGAGVGGVYGVASEGDLGERLAAAGEGMKWGGALGAAFPVAGRMLGQKFDVARTPAAIGVNALLGAGAGAVGAKMFGAPEENRGEWIRNGAIIGGGVTAAAPAIRGAYSGIRNALAPQGVRAAPVEPTPAPTRAAPDRVGNAPGGPPREYVGEPQRAAPPPPPPPRSRPTTEYVDDNIRRMAERRGLTPEKAEEIAADAEATGRNPLFAQVLGEPGLQRLQTNANLPGKTPQLAADTIRASRRGQSQRLTQDVDEALGTTQTRASMRADVDSRYQEMAPEYDALLGGARVTAEGERRAVEVLARIPKSELDPIREAAARIAQYDGKTFADLTVAQQLHYLKMGIGQRVAAMGREGLQGVERQRLAVALKDFRAAVEDAVPGYRGLNARWADNVQTEEAIAWADDLFAGGRNAMRPEEAKAAFDAMTPAQKEAAIVSIRNRIIQTIEDRAKTGQTSRNVADAFLSESFANRMRAVIGDDATALLMRRLRAEDRTFTELGTALPRAGAKTFPLFADMAEQMATGPAPRGIGNALMAGGDKLWQLTTNWLLEGVRNKEGARLLQQMTPAQIRALRKRMLEQIARREKLSRNAVSGGAQGGMITDSRQ